MTDDAIPAGMVPWLGGDAAPADWDGGPVLLRNCSTMFPSKVSLAYHSNGTNRWNHRRENKNPDWDIIAYTPAASSDERDGAREVRTILIRAGMHEDANSATQLIPYSIAARAVSEALAAIRPTDAHETPPVSQSGIQCFTCGETVQETSAGHCFSCIKSHRVPAASRPTDAGAGEVERDDADRANGIGQDELVAGLKRALQHPAGDHDGWTDAGMEDAFFRWPVIVNALNEALATPKPPVDEPWPGYTADQDRRRVETLAKLGLMLSVMAGGEAPEVTGFDAADLYGEVLMALAIEDAEDADIALQDARDDPEGHMLTSVSKPPVDEAMREALAGYRAAVSFIAADAWDGCSDCIEVLRAARAADWRNDQAANADETARHLARIRQHGRNLTGDGAGA